MFICSLNRIWFFILEIWSDGGGGEVVFVKFWKVFNGLWRWKEFFIWLSLYVSYETYLRIVVLGIFRLKNKFKLFFFCLKFGRFLWYLVIKKFLFIFLELIIVILKGVGCSSVFYYLKNDKFDNTCVYLEDRYMFFV